jgi:hypothetical protein
MQNAEPVRDVLRDGECAPAKFLTRSSLESPLPGNWHGGFGPGAAGKGPDYRHLASGLPVLRNAKPNRI